MDIYILKLVSKWKKCIHTYIHKHSNNSIITKNSRTHTQINATLAGVKSGVDSLTLSETLIHTTTTTPTAVAGRVGEEGVDVAYSKVYGQLMCYWYTGLKPQRKIIYRQGCIFSLMVKAFIQNIFCNNKIVLFWISQTVILRYV